MIAAIRKLLKGALFDSKGSLSLSRCVLVFVLAEVTAITWLAVAWCYWVTKHGLLVDAAPFASAVATGAAAVLSSQVAAAAFQYFSQSKWGGGGIAGRQLDIDEARTAQADPAIIPEIGPELVPSNPAEPRVAAETQTTETGTEPLKVDIVHLPEGESN